MDATTSCCPICGEEFKSSGIDDLAGHRCRPATLAAIDRALDHERDIVHVPQFVERLVHGFMLVGLADDAGADLRESPNPYPIDAWAARNFVRGPRETTVDKPQP